MVDILYLCTWLDRLTGVGQAPYFTANGGRFQSQVRLTLTILYLLTSVCGRLTVEFGEPVACLGNVWHIRGSGTEVASWVWGGALAAGYFW